MKKKTSLLSVAGLSELYAKIAFPEYQREPTIWSRAAKQRLVDSMLRQFDIASFYVYDNEDGSLDCVDGRQRIGAIMSFLGRNPEDEDNAFAFKILNEIFVDEDHPFAELEGLTYEEAAEKAKKGNQSATKMVKEFTEYALTFVRLSGTRRPEEFNLQFTRLNLGTIINSGEKLHAMVGDLRDVCFEDGGLGKHPFLEDIKIPTRRYSKEQVAAQILAQVFSLQERDEYTRTRHFDLQRLFKDQVSLSTEKKSLVEQLRRTLDLLANAFPDLSLLRNRAITVSTVLLAWRLGLTEPTEASKIAAFIEEFLCRLGWQIDKGFGVDEEYMHLIEFQRHVTQASVEKPAVENRARILEHEYALWKPEGALTGDREYIRRTGHQPSRECREAP